MRYLCRLITPPNGIVLDPYLGSGTTAVAAKLEGFQYIGIEMEADYCKIAEARVAECDRDYETKAEMLTDANVKEVFDIFDFIEG
jgi:site-specific DNA-methyltransferase (adenine-specific)